MARKSATPKCLAREAFPSYIIFEERSGVYWLRGQNLARARHILPIKSNADSVGFDKATMTAHARRLTERRINVGILKDNAIRTLQFQRSKKPLDVPSTAIGLAPSLLLGKRELERLERRITHKYSPFKDLTQRIKAELSNGHRASISDYGKVYVCEAWEGAYEVDWELISMSQTTFEALALATHLSRKKLVCQLVAPKPKRKNSATDTRPVPLVSEPVMYGQLRLPL